MESLWICVLLCGTPSSPSRRYQGSILCPNGQHIEGDYDRGYACISDAETAAAEAEVDIGCVR